MQTMRWGMVVGSVGLLAGCGPERSIQGYDHRVEKGAPLRLTDVGRGYDLQGSEVASLRGVTVDDRRVIGVSEDDDCLRVSEWRVEDLEIGIQEPRRSLVCDVPELRWRHLDHVSGGHGLLAVGSNLLRETPAGWAFEVELSGLIPAPQANFALVLGPEEVGLFTGRGMEVFDTTSGTWAHVARAPGLTPSNSQDVGDSFLRLGDAYYRRDGQTWTLDPQRVHWAEGEWALYFDTLFRRTPDGWELVSDQIPNGPRRQLHAGLTSSWSGETVRIFGVDGAEVASAVVSARAEGFVSSQHASAGTLLLWNARQFQLHWIHLAAEDPFASVPLDAVPVTVDRGEEVWFEVEVPEDAHRLEVELREAAAGLGDADLYVRRGDTASLQAYDCAPYLFGSNEACTFTDVEPGTWSVLVHGFSDGSEATLTVTLD